MNDIASSPAEQVEIMVETGVEVKRYVGQFCWSIFEIFGRLTHNVQMDLRSCERSLGGRSSKIRPL